MKRTIIIGTVSAAALLGIIFLISWFTKNDLEKTIITQRECYAEKWDLDSAYVDNQNKTVLISFYKKHGVWKNNIENIREIYERLSQKIYEDGSLKEYSIDFSFVDNGDLFVIRNITYNSNQMEIRCNTAVDLKTIADKFPQATELHLFPAIYNDISEIEGFNDLQYVYFSNTITDDEIAAIKSRFPDCEIEYDLGV